MAAATVTVLPIFANKWKDSLGVHIVQEETSNLLIRTKNLESLSRLNFEHIQNDVILIKTYANQVLNGTLPIARYYDSINAQSSIDSRIPDGGLDSNGMNANYSSWWNKFGSTPASQPYLDNSSIFDNVWRSIFKSNKKYQGVYVGFKDALFRHLPWQRFEDYPTFSYVCLLNNQPTTGYDPRCRNWYINANNDQSKVLFTEPYTDAGTNQVLISASHAILDPNGFAGVVAVDISMQDLETFILNENVLENGYSYMVDKNRNVVIYPSLDRSRLFKIEDLEFVDANEKQAFITLFNQINSNTVAGQSNFTKGGQPWLLSYKNVENTDYMVAMVVPHSNLRSAVNPIEESINIALGVAIALTIVFTIIMIITSLFVNRKIAQHISEPIQHFDQVTKKVAEGDLDIELGNINPKSPEIAMVYDNFSNLLKAVRFANRDYFRNNIGKAYQNYLQVEEMLTSLQNKRGLGVVWNNLGLAVKEMDTVKDYLQKSEEYFNKAIANAVELGDEAETQAGKTLFKITLANRYMNLGLYFADVGDTTQAREMYEKSIQLHKETDNKLGEIKTKGNYGMLLTNMNDFEGAFGMLNESYNVAVERYISNSTDQNREVLQYASMNMGRFYQKRGEFPEAIRHFNYALSLPRSIDTNFQSSCLLYLSESYRSMGNTQLANEIRGALDTSVPKHVTFVLDTSGSMGGNYIERCRASITTILQNFMSEKDSVSLLTFNTQVTWTFQNKSIAEDVGDAIYKVQNNTKTGGQTAFYDAVYTACEYVSGNEYHNKDQWIVALTDGEDNRSRKNSTAIANHIRQNGLNIIVITVGDLNNIRNIKEIAEASENGLHLSARNVEGIEEAFGQVAELISRGQVNIETL